MRGRDLGPGRGSGEPASAPIEPSEAAAATSGANVARWSVWAFLGSGLPQLYVVVSSAVIARYLGSSAFGRIALIVSVEAAVGTFVPFGVPTTAIRFVGSLLGAGRLSEANGVYRWTWTRTVVQALVAFVAMLGVALAGARPTTAWYLVAFATPFTIAHTAPSSLLIGAQRWREARIVGITTGVGGMLAKVAVAVGGGGIADLFLVDLCLAVANLAGTAYLARRVHRELPPPQFPADLHRAVRRFSLISTITTFTSFVVYQRTEVFVLAHYRNDTDIARYTVPFSLVTALLLIPSALTTVVTPAFATLWGAQALDSLRRGYSRAIRLVSLLTLVFVGGVVVVGADLIRIVYGPQFAGVRLVVSILALSVPFVPLAALSSSLLRGMGILGAPTIAGAAAAVADVGLSFALIPTFGTGGAATANVLAQVVFAVPLLVYAGRRLGRYDLAPLYLLRALVGTGLAVAAALPLALGLSAAPGLFAGLAVYLGVLLLLVRPLPPISREDASWLAALMPQRLDRVTSVIRIVSGGRAATARR